MSDRPLFIEDGYTQTETIDAGPFYKGIKVKFRPCVGAARAEYLDAAADLNAAKQRPVTDAMLAKHVLEINGEGPYTAEQFATMHDVVHQAIQELVASLGAYNGRSEAQAKN